MGNCQTEETAKVGDVAAEPALEWSSVVEAPKPLWRIVVEEQIAAEAEAAVRLKKEQDEAAEKAQEEAKRKAEEEEEAKRQEEEAKKKKEEEEEAAAKASKKKSAEGKPKKRVTGSPKKGSGAAAPAKAATEPQASAGAVEELKKEAEKATAAPEGAAPTVALDRAAIKERDKAFKERPAQQQEQLGAQLRAAAKSGNTHEAKRLLESGVVPNLADKDGWIPLMEAAQAGSAECCSELLMYGADPKATIKLGEWGMTALHYAARKGHLDVAKVLLPVSDLSIKNFQGRTAREVAKAEGHAEMAKLVRSSK